MLYFKNFPRCAREFVKYFIFDGGDATENDDFQIGKQRLRGSIVYFCDDLQKKTQRLQALFCFFLEACDFDGRLRRCD